VPHNEKRNLVGNKNKRHADKSVGGNNLPVVETGISINEHVRETVCETASRSANHNNTIKNDPSSNVCVQPDLLDKTSNGENMHQYNSNTNDTKDQRINDSLKLTLFETNDGISSQLAYAKNADAHNEVNPEAVLGKRHEQMQKFNRDLVHITITLLENDKFSNEPSRDKVIDVLVQFGKYFHDNCEYQEALDYLKMAEKMFEKVDHSITNSTKQICTYWMGKCLFGLQNFLEAIIKFRSVLEVSFSLTEMETFLKKKCIKSECWKEIAKCRVMLKQYENACESFSKAFNGYEIIDDNDEASYCLLKLACCLYNMNKFEDAAKKFELQLEYLLKATDKSIPRREKYMAICYYHLGRSMLKLKKNEDGIHNFEAALKLCHQDKDLNQLKTKSLMAKCWLLKAVSERRLKNYAEAWKGFSESLDLWKHIDSIFGDAAHAKYIALCHECISSLNHHENFRKTAIYHALEALNIYNDKTKITFATTRQTIYCKLMQLNQRLGDLYKASKKYNEACFYYNAALSIQPQQLDNSTTYSFRVSARLHKLCGFCLKNSGKRKDAENCFKSALQDNLKCMKSSNLSNLHVLRDIGQCYWDLKDYTQAKQFFEQYVALIESYEYRSPRINSNIAYVLKQLGRYWKHKNKFHTAFIYFQQSLSYFKLLNKHPKFDFEILTLLHEIGKHYLYSIKTKIIAKQFLDEAIELGKTLHQSPSVLFSLSLCYKGIGECYRAQNSFTKAVESFTEAQNIITGLEAKTSSALVKQKYNFQLAMLSKAMGFCYKFKGLLSESINHFKFSLYYLEKLPKRLGPSGPTKYCDETAFILKNVGLNLIDLKEYETAILYFIKSCNIYNTLPNTENKKIQIALNWENSGICSKALNRLALAKYQYKNALRIYYQKLPWREKYHRKVVSLEREIDHLNRAGITGA